MPYIGNTPAEKYVSLAALHFTVSATTSYTLTHAVTNEVDIALFINNVRQQPGGSYAYTASGTTLTLSAATAGTDTMYCVYLGKAIGTITPPDNSVDSAKIVNGSITEVDLADDAVTADKIHDDVALGGPSLGTSSIMRTNGNTISENITIPSGTNAMSVGPMTLAVGNTITCNGVYTVI